MNAEVLLSQLDQVKPQGANQWQALCPAHDDKDPSLSVKQADNGKVLVTCHAGCSADSVISAVGLTWKDLSNGQRPDPKKAAEEKRERAEEKRRANEKAAKEAQRLWNAAKPAGEKHQYLLSKGVQPHGTRLGEGGRLLVPLVDVDGKLWSLQTIAGAGSNGDQPRKLFLTGGKVLGCYYPIGELGTAEVLCIAEGFATAASVHEATGLPVAVAFNAGNLVPVAKALRGKHPDLALIVCGDDDYDKADNPGRTKAELAAKSVGGVAVFPDFGDDRPEGATDFNDLHQARGPEAVAACVRAGVEAEAESDVPKGIVDTMSEDSLALSFVDGHPHLKYLMARAKWYRWDGMRWAIDSTGSVYQDIRVMLRHAVPLTPGDRAAAQLRSKNKVAAVETLSRYDPRAAAVIEQWDADDWHLNTKSGIVDLRDGGTSPHSMYENHTKIAGTGPGGSCPMWLAFLKEVMAGDKELISFLRRSMGYTLTGSVQEHVLFFCYGTGRNGKGVFLNTLAGVLGDYATIASMEVFTETHGDRHPTEIATLQGARMVVAQETEEARRWAVTRIKTLTGGDPVSARFMRGDFFTFRPNFKLWMSGNHKPNLRSVDEAIRARIRIIPFTVTIPEEKRDPRLEEKLREEWPGILQWALDGCLEYQREGLNAPEAVMDSTNEYFEEQNLIAQWLEDCCEEGKDYVVNPTAAFKSWKEYAEQHNERTGRQSDFRERLETLGFRQDREAKGGARFWKGFRLRIVVSPSEERFY